MNATTGLTPELLEQVKKLTPAEKHRLSLLLDEDDGDAEAVRLAWKHELARRITAYERGEVQAVDGKEASARNRAAFRSEFGYDS